MITGLATTLFILLCICWFYQMVIRRGIGDFDLYDENFGDMSLLEVKEGTFAVFMEDGSRSVEYCCKEHHHETGSEALACWQQWRHYIEMDPLLCDTCGSNIDVQPDLPCLQCAVNAC